MNKKIIWADFTFSGINLWNLPKQYQDLKRYEQINEDSIITHERQLLKSKERLKMIKDKMKEMDNIYYLRTGKIINEEDKI